jgi:DNA-binding CsgD family transcriptional regulator
MRPARLSVYQSPRNPTPREREILTLIAEGRTQKQAAARLGLAHHSLSNALGHMRDRYNFTTNEALIAAAVKLDWISLAIDTTADPKHR